MLGLGKTPFTPSASGASTHFYASNQTNVKDSEHSHRPRRRALTRFDACWRASSNMLIMAKLISKCFRFDAQRVVKARQRVSPRDATRSVWTGLMTDRCGSHLNVALMPLKTKVKVAGHLYSASSEMIHFWSAQAWITQLLHCKHSVPAFYLVSLHQWLVVAAIDPR